MSVEYWDDYDNDGDDFAVFTQAIKNLSIILKMILKDY